MRTGELTTGQISYLDPHKAQDPEPDEPWLEYVDPEDYERVLAVQKYVIYRGNPND